MSTTFFILSLKYSPNPSGHSVFWKPDDRGYTSDISKAGYYSHAQVMANPLYYSNGETTKAVPVDEVLAASKQVVPYPFP